VIAWDWYYDLCIADTRNPKKYNRYSLKELCNFGASWTKISGNGKTVCFVDDDNLYISDITNFKIGKIEKLELNKYGQPRSLAIDYTGNKIIVSIMGKRTPETCDPIWENAVLFTRNKSNWDCSLFIRKTNECEFVNNFRFVSNNSIYYNLRNLNKNTFLIVKNSIDYKGNWCCNKSLNFSADHLLDINPEGNLFIMSFKKLMNNGDSVLSIFQSHLINDSTLSKPEPILKDHKDPIVWGTQLTHQGDKLLWTHYIRGKDGDSIIKREIKMVEYINNKWAEPETIFEMPPNLDDRDFTCSNKNILFTTYTNDRKNEVQNSQKNRLFFYTTLSKTGELIEIEQLK
jgi:hypothetical protein